MKLQIEVEINEDILRAVSQGAIDRFFGKSAYSNDSQGAEVIQKMTRKALESAIAPNGQVEQLVNSIVAEALAGDVVETLVNEQIDRLVNRKVQAMVKAWQEAGK